MECGCIAEDEDECARGSHDCSRFAVCGNTIGSFTCTCNSGFVGDGKNCIREHATVTPAVYAQHY